MKMYVLMGSWMDGDVWVRQPIGVYDTKEQAVDYLVSHGCVRCDKNWGWAYTKEKKLFTIEPLNLNVCVFLD